MRRLIYSFGVSLDGFVNDPGGGIDWSEPDDELHQFHNDRYREFEISLHGRRLYELMAEHWPYVPDSAGSIEREFAHRDPVAQLFGIGHAHRRQQRQRDRQVVMRPLLRQVGGGEVDRYPLGRQRQPHSRQRRAHAFLAFADRLVGQADDVELGQTRRDRALNFHAARFEPQIGNGFDQRDQRESPPP